MIRCAFFSWLITDSVNGFIALTRNADTVDKAAVTINYISGLGHFLRFESSPGSSCDIELRSRKESLEEKGYDARDVDSRHAVLLHPSGGHNCLTRC